MQRVGGRRRKPVTRNEIQFPLICFLSVPSASTPSRSRTISTTLEAFLIKEINNLVMLSRPFADKDAVLKKLKYRSADALERESIRAYVAENNGLTRCRVDEFGIEMPVFDTTIDQINRVSNELASRSAEETETRPDVRVTAQEGSRG